MDNKKLYNIKAVVYTIQVISILLIIFSKVDLVLKLMLVIGYYMLFRQERWYKHLYIMCIMLAIFFAATNIYIQ